MEQEGSLFRYLDGGISFNEWLDGQEANLNFVEGLLGTGRQREDVLESGFAEEAPNRGHDDDDDMHDAGRSDQHDPLDFDDDSNDYFSDDYAEDLLADVTDFATAEEFTKELKDGVDESKSKDNNTQVKAGQGQPGMSSTVDSLQEFTFPRNINSSKVTSDDFAMSIVQLIKSIHELLTSHLKELSHDADDIIAKSMHELNEPKMKRLKKSGPSSHKLREDLRQQMGVANLYLAKGQIEEAINICMEIIRQAPHNPHAFKTLSVIYEEKGDAEKALQFSLISAFIGCRDPFEWRDLAQRCLQTGLRKQAILCYNQGCRYAPKNLFMLWERAALYFENEDYRKVLDYQHLILKLVSNYSGDKIMDIAKAMAQVHHDDEQCEKAVDILEFVFQKYPDIVDSEGLNILAELHISTKNFDRALQVICTYAGVNIPGVSRLTPETGSSGSKDQPSKDVLRENLANVLNGSTSSIPSISNSQSTPPLGATPECHVPDLTSIPSSWTDFLLSPQKDNQNQLNVSESNSEKSFLDLDKQTKSIDDVESENAPNDDWMIPDVLPIDLRVKIALCLILLNKQSSIEHILEPLREENVEDVGDLYLDVAEAFIDVGRYEDAIFYLEYLVDVEKYSMAAVWLKLAECKNAAGYIEEAINAYYRVIQLAPDQLSVRLELSNLCRSLGRNDEAIEILSDKMIAPGEESNKDGESLIIEISKKEDFLLWHQKCTILHRQRETALLAESGYIFFMNYFKSAAIIRDDGLSKAMVWEMLLKVLQAMITSKCNGWASEILEKALNFRPYCENKRYRFELDFLGMTVYFLTKEYLKAFDMFRWALIRSEKRGLHKPAMWNFFSLIVNNLHDRRYHRYVLRLLFKQPAILPLIITNGHNAFLCGSYKYALGEYIRAFRIKPTEPLISLCVGITYLHLACQRFTKHRHTSVLQGISFLMQYYEMRGKNQEACYNLGRSFHQVGLVHLSVEFYNKALDFPYPSADSDPKSKEFDTFNCLHREAAYNLALIYNNSGNGDLARRTLYKYIWV